jgi:hypothetical protein
MKRIRSSAFFFFFFSVLSFSALGCSETAACPRTSFYKQNRSARVRKRLCFCFLSKQMDEDPFAALDSLAARVRESDDDPFAALAALGENTNAKEDINALFDDLEKSACSLSTVLAGCLFFCLFLIWVIMRKMLGFFYEEFGVVLGSDDVLTEKGLGVEHLDALQEFLTSSSFGIVFPEGKELKLMENGNSVEFFKWFFFF